MNASRILFWNVRGLNSVARRGVVRALVDAAKMDIICLQETKWLQFLVNLFCLCMEVILTTITFAIL